MLEIANIFFWKYMLDNCPLEQVIWRCHIMEIFSALLALYEENPPVSNGFP